MAAIIVGILALLGVIITGIIAWWSNKGSASNQFTTNVLGRLATVEKQVEELQEALTLSQRAMVAAVRFIDRLVDWGRHGGKGKMPTPSPELHVHLDPTIWGESELKG